VTPFLYRHPERFALRNFAAEDDHSAHRWTLDTAEDWQLIAAVYDALYVPGRCFGMGEMLEFLALHPELVALNAHVEQKKLAAPS
jgi:spore coat polysaccharide biosynthesis protein SpsF